MIPRFFTRGSFRNPGFWSPPPTKRDRHARVSAILPGFSNYVTSPSGGPLAAGVALRGRAMLSPDKSGPRDADVKQPAWIVTSVGAF